MNENKLLSELGRRVLVFDGATGTSLQNMGLAPGELSDAWNITHPDIIYGLHRAYLDAGADFVSTNTFVTSRLKHDNAAEIAVAAAKLARRAVDDSGHGYVALDIGPTGMLMRPLGELTLEYAVELWGEIITAAAPYCDCVLFETMTDVYEAKAGIIAAKESCSLPIFVSYTVDDAGRLLSGADIETLANVSESLGITAIGLNCGVGPDSMERTLPRLLASTTLPVMVSPNAGLPTVEGEHLHYHIDPDEYAAAHGRMVELGAAVVGGCCGTTPDFIARVSRLVGGRDVKKRSVTLPTMASSSTSTVVFGKRPIVIGERINPTGKPKLKAAMKDLDNNLDHILSLAYSQADAHADALDINCGVPETDEAASLTRVVDAVQSSVTLPLVIDSSSPAALEAAMRICGGKPIVNSVNGKHKVMDDVFPLVKKYGGVVIGLLLDEDGIPATVDGRMAIARRIVEAAESYGIQRRDILIDALTLTVAADPNAAVTTLETVRRVTDELRVGTVLGVSNVSFGLPDRDSVNAAFLTLALGCGLSAAIMNPESAAMAGAVRAFRALHGDFTGDNTADVENASTIAEAVFRGHRAEAASLTVSALADGKSSMEIIDGCIIPGLSRLGKEYEAGKVFLPQLMAGADAASASFAEIKKTLGSVAADKGTIVLATVEGDVHDIGKNICAAILSNYGYDVRDLGRDVKPDRVVEEVLNTGARLVGLSALMTTTVPAMKRTIEALRASDADCKILVGGAVLTEDLAAEIGADYYSPDAMSDVKIAAEVYGR